MDLLSKWRDEAGPSSTMAWLRHHDRYEDRPLIPAGRMWQPRRARSGG